MYTNCTNIYFLSFVSNSITKVRCAGVLATKLTHQGCSRFQGRSLFVDKSRCVNEMMNWFCDLMANGWCCVYTYYGISAINYMAYFLIIYINIMYDYVIMAII